MASAGGGSDGLRARTAVGSAASGSAAAVGPGFGSPGGCPLGGEDLDEVFPPQSAWTATVNGRTCQGQAVAVSFPTAADERNALQEGEGHDVASFSDLSVENRSTAALAVPGAPTGQRDPLTAGFDTVPAAHGGAATFETRILLSEDISLTAANFRDNALQATNGTVSRARRVAGRDDFWRIDINPGSNADTTVTLPANGSRSQTAAIGTADDRQLTTRLEQTVTGKDDPEASTEAGSRHVTERAPATFTVHRTGSTAAALTVQLSATETGAFLAGQLASTVEIPVAASQQTLTLATDGDSVSESAGSVRVEIDDDTTTPPARSRQRHPGPRAGAGQRRRAGGAGARAPWVAAHDADPLALNPQREWNPDPRSRRGSAALAGGAAETDPRAILDGEHAGAFGTHNWLDGWTFFGAEFDYDTRGRDGAVN